MLLFYVSFRMLRTVLTNRILRFLHDKSQKETESYNTFYRDYGIFLKEGIISSTDQHEKVKSLFNSSSDSQLNESLFFNFDPPWSLGRDIEIAEVRVIDIAPRWESQSSRIHFPDATRSKRYLLPRYSQVTIVKILKTNVEWFHLWIFVNKRIIVGWILNSRELAESSPYFESMKKRNAEVLFCFEPYDELVLLQLRQFDKKQLTSVEKEMRQELSPEEDKSDDGKWTLSDVITSIAHHNVLKIFGNTEKKKLLGSWKKKREKAFKTKIPKT